MVEEPRDRWPKADSAFDSDYHAPVLCKTAVEELVTDPSGVYVDGTVGGGGHTAALLMRLTNEARVVGLDRDPQAIQAAATRLKADVESGRLRLFESSFGALKDVVDALSITAIDGVLFDLGVSSHQLDVGERGFSHQREGPLDMRMEPTLDCSADTIVNEWSERELVNVLRRFGEEPRARKIARAIISNRPLRSTTELAERIREVVPKRDKVKTLSRVFQAIRIVVNDELQEIKSALAAATDCVRPGGRVAVISYHSLEDRLVKRFVRYGNFEGVPQRDLYGHLLSPWTPQHRKPLMPDPAELARNPRARSARLRVGVRLG